MVGDPAIRPPAGTTGTLGWIDFLLAFIGAPVSFLVVLVYAVVASPMTRADPGLLEAGLRGRSYYTSCFFAWGGSFL